MKKIQIPALTEGTLVGVMNCVGYYKIVRRVRKNVYLVDYKGHQVELQRNQLSVKP